MKFPKTAIALLCVVLLVSIGLNVAQFIIRRSEFRQASERFMIQLNNDIWDAYGHLNGIIDGRTSTIAGTDTVIFCYRSPESIQTFGLQLSGIHSLLSSNAYLRDVYWNFTPDFRAMGEVIYGGGIMSSPRFSGNFPGIHGNGVVSENEIIFLEALRDVLGVLWHNACLDIRSFNERLYYIREEWEGLPAELLAAG